MALAADAMAALLGISSAAHALPHMQPVPVERITSPSTS